MLPAWLALPFLLLQEPPRDAPQHRDDEQEPVSQVPS